MEVSQLREVLAGASISTLFLLTYLLDPIGLPLFSLLAIATVIGSSLSPVGSIGAIAFTLPLFNQPLAVGTSSFGPSELVLVLTVIGAAINVFVRIIWQFELTVSWLNISTSRMLRSYLVISLSILTVTGGVLLNFLFDPNAFSASLREWRWTLFEPLLFLALLIVFATTSKDRSVVTGFFIAGGLLLAMLGIVDLISGSGISGDSITRISGPYPHPNAFSQYLMRPLVFAIALITFSRNRNPWLIAFVGVAMISIAASFSRAAFTALAFVLGIFTVHTGRKTRSVVLGALVLASAAMIIVASDRMLSAFSGGSLSLRLEIWQSSVEMIRDRPVAGYGPDQFFYAYSPRYVSAIGWSERFTSHAHNLVIDYWIRLGIIGAVFAATAVLFGIKAVADITWRGRKRSLLQSAAIIAFGAAILQALVDNGYFVHDLAMSAWLLAFLAFDSPADEPVSISLEN